MVVSSVQHLPSFSRTMPRPRATAVSKVNQPSTTPSVAVASRSIFQLEGFTVASVSFSIASIAGRPSSVMMFQVKDTRSRQ